MERIRRAFDAFNRRDLDVFLALIDPEVEFTTRYMEMEGDPYYRGRDLQEVCMPVRQSVRQFRVTLTPEALNGEDSNRRAPVDPVA